MTPICVSLACSKIDALKKDLQQASILADWIEVRLDACPFTSADLHALKALTHRPLVFTLRSAHRGGFFNGSNEERVQLLQKMALAKPVYMDLEADLPLEQIIALQLLSPQTKWIISLHTSFPPCLDECVDKLMAIPGHYYKLAMPVESILQALQLLEKAKQVNVQKANLCLIGQGKAGECTRVLSPLAGQPFTFACLERGKETASGQIDIYTLLNIYYFKTLHTKTTLYGLAGDPIDLSPSHRTHNALFRQLGLDAVYYKFHVKKEELDPFLKMIRCFSIQGMSLTMPHKEGVAKEACNTLHFTEGGDFCFNTDGIGALRVLGNVKGKKIIILGAGGTAYAIAKAACQEGGDVTICNRTSHRARQAAAQIGCAWGEEVPASYDILINATSVGMSASSNEMPLPPDRLLPRTVVLDAIASRDTPLLRAARVKGCKIHTGFELFAAQAAKQFKIWFGERIDEEKVKESIDSQLLEIKVKKSQLQGSLILPPSKSHTIRAVLLGAMAEGVSQVEGALDSPDTERAIEAAEALGAKVQRMGTMLSIQGVGGQPAGCKLKLDAGNSGQVLRFAAALAAVGEGEVHVTGDQSICSNRPVDALLDGLSKLGASYSPLSCKYAPFVVKGPLKPGKVVMEGMDSQPVSALLLAAAFLDGSTEIIVEQAGEKPWLALTLSWLDRLGVHYTQEQLARFIIYGKKRRPSFKAVIPGDMSSAAFPLAAALVTHSKLVLEGADMEDVQGDKELIYFLQNRGATIEFEQKRLTVLPTGSLKGGIIDVNPIIDAIPILAVLGCFGEFETHLINAANGRNKESDRLSSISKELKKMGACIEEDQASLYIQPSPLKGAVVQSHGDHRIAMALIVAGMGAEGETVVQDVGCIKKSYPNFIEEMKKLGACID